MKDPAKSLDLSVGLLESFEYITETGSCWKGNVQHATFQIHCGRFESYLRRRGFFEVDPESLNAEETAEVKSSPWYTFKQPLIHRTVTPAGWNEVDEHGGRSIRWEYQNYRPGDIIRVCYWMAPIPQNADDLRLILPTMADHPTAANLADLREILLAASGIAPKRKSAQDFVANQIWYQPNSSRKEADLKPDQWAMLRAVDELIQRARSSK